MFVPTGKTQTELFGIENYLGPEKLKRLERSWAGTFRRCALPLIDEGAFAAFYSPDKGAPCKSARLLAALLVLKEVWDATDEGILERLEWDLQMQYALEIKPAEAYVCRKTLHNFRVNLVNGEMGRSVFDRLTGGIAKLEGISMEKQRTDSTHIFSNMKLLSRLGLFVATIEGFLFKLKRMDEKLLEGLPKRFFERYLEREGYFADSPSSKAKRRLADCAKDVWRLLDRYRGNKKVAELKQYGRLERLFRDQCEIRPGGGGGPKEERVELKPPGKVRSDSMQSPSDEDATYGYKGKGYEAQVTETCGENNALQLITDVEVTPSCGSDQAQAIETINRLEEAGRKPKELLGDQGYGSGANIVKAEKKEVELKTPVKKAAPDKEALGLGDFIYGKDYEMMACPGGREPAFEEASKTEGRTNAYFDREHCNSCPHDAVCPGTKTKSHRRVGYSAAKAATAFRQCEQTAPEFKEAYKLRSGIEATNSELKRKHGMGRLRVRGQPQVTFAVCMKAAACNVKRYLNYAYDTAGAASKLAPVAC